MTLEKEQSRSEAWSKERRLDHRGDNRVAKTLVDGKTSFYMFPGTKRFSCGIESGRRGVAYLDYDPRRGEIYSRNVSQILDRRNTFLAGLTLGPQGDFASRAFDEAEAQLNAGIPEECISLRFY